MLFTVAMLACITTGCAKQPKISGSIDDSATMRQREDEGDLHYIDDEAIPRAGEYEKENTKAEAMATLVCVNAERASYGLGELTWNENLREAAQVRAVECEQEFSHTRPNGTDWYTVNSEIMFGENLAKNYFDADTVVQAWMDSPTHKENILNESFATMGVAAFETQNGTWYWAQAFGY